MVSHSVETDTQSHLSHNQIRKGEVNNNDDEENILLTPLTISS